MPDDRDVPDEQTLRRFLQGRLTSAEAERVKRFLQTHPEAVNTLHALSQAESPAVDRREPPVDILAERAAAGTEPAGEPGRRRGLLVLLAMVLAVLIGGGFMIYRIVFQPRDGTLVVAYDDEEAKTRLQTGELLVLDPDGRLKYALRPAETDRIEVAPGRYEVRVGGAAGVQLDMQEFTMKKRGEITVRVSAKDRPSGGPSADQRKALEWVLANGGAFELEIGSKRMTVRPGQRLPDEPFVVHTLRLGRKGLTEPAAENLRSVPRVRQGLSLDRSDVSDAVLGRLATIPGLVTATHLVLSGTPVTDAGLAHLRAFALSDLDLRECPGVTDAGLKQLAACKSLTRVRLGRTQVTAAGIEALAAARPQCWIEWDGGVVEPRK